MVPRKRFEEAILAAPMNPNAKLVAMVVGSFGNWTKKQEVWPSIQTIAERTGLTRGTVKEYVDALVDQGWLVVTKVRPGNVQQYALEVSVVEPFDKLARVSRAGGNSNLIKQLSSHPTSEVVESSDKRLSSGQKPVVESTGNQLSSEADPVVEPLDRNLNKEPKIEPKENLKDKADAASAAPPRVPEIDDHPPGMNTSNGSHPPVPGDVGQPSTGINTNGLSTGTTGAGTDPNIRYISSSDDLSISLDELCSTGGVTDIRLVQIKQWAERDFPRRNEVHTRRTILEKAKKEFEGGWSGDLQELYESIGGEVAIEW